eukprot:g2267.t1
MASRPSSQASISSSAGGRSRSSRAASGISNAKDEKNVLKGKELEQYKIRTQYQSGSLFAYGEWQNNDVLRALFDRVPDKEVALLLSEDVYGPYIVKEE